MEAMAEEVLEGETAEVAVVINERSSDDLKDLMRFLIIHLPYKA